MSTRKILKQRRRIFKLLAKKEPRDGYIKAIEEIDFIFEKLVEYDSRKKEN